MVPKPILLFGPGDRLSRTRMRSRLDFGTDRHRRGPGELHPRIPESVAPGGAPIPRGIKLRQQLVAARMWLPALAALVASLLFVGTDGEGIVRAGTFTVAIVLVARLLGDFAYPLRLIPASRYALCVLPALSGAVAVAALGLAEDDAIVVSDFLPALAAATLVALAVEVVGDRLISRRPLRLAVLGAADFVPAIRRELDAIGGAGEIEVIGWLNLGGTLTPGYQGRRAHSRPRPCRDHRARDRPARPRPGLRFIPIRPRRLRRDRRRLPRPAGPDDRRQPALRAASSATSRSGRSTRPGSCSCMHPRFQASSQGLQARSSTSSSARRRRDGAAARGRSARSRSS